MPEQSLKYKLDEVDYDLFLKDVDQIWNRLHSDPEFQKIATEAGIDLAETAPLVRKKAIDIGQEGFGLDPATTAVVVAFAPAVALVAKDIWTQIILPRLTEKYGPRAIKPASDH